MSDTPFFTTNFMTSTYSSALSASQQGQLSSAYTAAMTDLVKGLADYFGFAAAVDQSGGIEAGLAVKASIAAGEFVLSDLFSAAQSKGTTIADPTNPKPLLTVGEFIFDLSEILTGLDTET